jgi:hypothetical protein
MINKTPPDINSISTTDTVAEMHDAIANAGLEAPRASRKRTRVPLEDQGYKEPESKVTKIPETEPEPEEVEEPEQTYTTEEQEAMGRGWKPESEFKGDKNEFRSAKEFLGRAELYDSLADTRKETKRLQAAVKLLTDVNTRQHKMIHQDRLEWFKAQKKAAIDISNADDVDKYDKAIKDTQEELERYSPEKIAEATKEVAAAAQPPPEVKAFIDRNSWTTETTIESKRMQTYAVAYESRLANEQPNLSVADRLAETEREIREIFPHRFENRNRMRASAVNQVAPENVSMRKTTKRKYTIADIPAADKQTVLYMSRLSKLPVEEYVEQLFTSGAYNNE